MTEHGFDLSIVVFIVSILGTLFMVFRGARDSRDEGSAALSDQHLNRWLVGLSAGATANSGFVVTAAVGLGYSYGAKWLLLPFGWMLGDLLFWSVFPGRLNKAGRQIHAKTMTDLLVNGMAPRAARLLRFFIGILILFCLSGYVSAQWLAGQKFLNGAFGFSNGVSLSCFAVLIIFYTAVGGFRGSVYADTLQALVRIVGTLIALGAIWVIAHRHIQTFWTNINSAGPQFLSPLNGGPVWVAIAMVLGFAAASLGFGLGQPQIVTRYLAGANSKETQAAWWIYIGFVQFTWMCMTIFGIALRGVMPAIPDPETGLSLFHHSNTGPLITGIISSDIFATIAAAANGLLVAMSQTLSRDVLGRNVSGSDNKTSLLLTAGLGATTMMIAFNLHGTVVSLALSSVSIMGAGLAPAMLIRVLGWRYTEISLTLAILAGTIVAIVWSVLGYAGTLNEAAPGIVCGLLVNFVVARTQLPHFSFGGVR